MATKIGDIYRTKQTENGIRYIQLIAIDPLNMNSDAIAVFKPSIADIGANLKKENLDFYTHTTVKQGILQGLWEKVGSADVTLDLSSLVFKNYYGDEHGEIADEFQDALPVPYPNWAIWTLTDKEMRYVDEREGMGVKAEDGGIVPASDIIYRIENGASEFKLEWPEA